MSQIYHVSRLVEDDYCFTVIFILASYPHILCCKEGPVTLERIDRPQYYYAYIPVNHVPVDKSSGALFDAKPFPEGNFDVQVKGAEDLCGGHHVKDIGNQQRPSDPAVTKPSTTYLHHSEVVFSSIVLIISLPSRTASAKRGSKCC